MLRKGGSNPTRHFCAAPHSSQHHINEINHDIHLVSTLYYQGYDINLFVHLSFNTMPLKELRWCSMHVKYESF